MNNQEAYDKMRPHLLSMKKRSIHEGLMTCAYNTDDDEHCPVGVLLIGCELINDENIKPIRVVIASNEAVRERLEGVSPVFLQDCQLVHDTTHYWSSEGLNYSGRKALDRLAARWNLQC
jgi:hypothetical protein